MSSLANFSALQQEPQTGLYFRIRVGTTPPRARLLLLHGVGGNETNLAGFAPYLPADLEVLLLQAPLQISPQGYAWFQVSFTAQGPRINESQAQASRELLQQFIGTQSSIPTVIAGFSQGGIMSACVGLSAPALVAGFGLLSGRILPEIEPHIAPREDLQRLSAFIAHGRHDDKLPLFWAERATEWLQRLGVPHQTHIYDTNHEIIEKEILDFVEWLNATLESR